VENTGKMELGGVCGGSASDYTPRPETKGAKLSAHA
jgi:hypothetical protein